MTRPLKRPDNAEQWAATADKRTNSERAIDAYLATRPGSEEAVRAIAFVVARDVSR